MDDGQNEPVVASPQVTTLEDGQGPASRDGVQDALVGLRATLAAVLDQLRATDERAAARERIIDRLHEENQRLRAGDRQLVLRPVLVDLQQLRTELLRGARDVPAAVTPEQV